MRLWHINLLPYLPKSQLLSQKRECDLIWKDIKAGKKTNHILINYIWNYDLCYFQYYYNELQREYSHRKYNFRNNSLGIKIDKKIYCYNEHNFDYLTICYYNLKEKYMRKQKDFTDEIWSKLDCIYQIATINNDIIEFYKENGLCE